jgi:hypothetical protein
MSDIVSNHVSTRVSEHMPDVCPNISPTLCPNMIPTACPFMCLLVCPTDLPNFGNSDVIVNAAPFCSVPTCYCCVKELLAPTRASVIAYVARPHACQSSPVSSHASPCVCVIRVSNASNYCCHPPASESFLPRTHSPTRTAALSSLHSLFTITFAFTNQNTHTHDAFRYTGGLNPLNLAIKSYMPRLALAALSGFGLVYFAPVETYREINAGRATAYDIWPCVFTICFFIFFICSCRDFVLCVCVWGGGGGGGICWWHSIQ